LPRSCLVRADGRILFRQRDRRARAGRIVQGVAVVARDIVLLVLAGIPEREMAVTLVAAKADGGLLFGGNLLVVESDDAGNSPAAASLGMLERVAVTGLAIWAFEVALLAMLGGQVRFDVFLMAAFADFRLGCHGAGGGSGGSGGRICRHTGGAGHS